MINNNINNNYYSLKFVNNTYMKLHERVHENIYYYPDINHIPIHSQQPNKHKHSRMKVIDIVKIYEQCSLMDKETKEVRTIF